jgi:hypothetical protein
LAVRPEIMTTQLLPLVKLLDSTDSEEVKMWADKLRLILEEIRTLLLQIIDAPPEPETPGTAVWSVGAFFGGEITVGQAVPRFIIPEAADGFSLTHLKVSYQAGTPTGNTEIEVSLLSGGITTLLGTSVLASTDLPDVVLSVTLGTPVSLATGDVVIWECVTAGAHEEVTAVVVGSQST